MGSYIMDGNFSAQHMQMKNPKDDVRLADGHGFMVSDAAYKDHLKTAIKPPKQVNLSMSLIVLSFNCCQKLECHEHQAVTASGAERGKLEATGIGAAACSRHGMFVPHCVVDYQKGEQCVYFISCYVHIVTD